MTTHVAKELRSKESFQGLFFFIALIYSSIVKRRDDVGKVVTDLGTSGLRGLVVRKISG